MKLKEPKNLRQIVPRNCGFCRHFVPLYADTLDEENCYLSNICDREDSNCRTIDENNCDTMICDYYKPVDY